MQSGGARRIEYASRRERRRPLKTCVLRQGFHEACGSKRVDVSPGGTGAAAIVRFAGVGEADRSGLDLDHATTVGEDIGAGSHQADRIGFMKMTVEALHSELRLQGLALEAAEAKRYDTRFPHLPMPRRGAEEDTYDGHPNFPVTGIVRSIRRKWEENYHFLRLGQTSDGAPFSRPRSSGCANAQVEVSKLDLAILRAWLLDRAFQRFSDPVVARL